MNQWTAPCRRLEQNICVATARDAMTGLHSGPALIRMVDVALRREQPFTLIVLLMEGLLHHSEHHGIDAGEHMLRTVAKRFGEIVDPEDAIARIDAGIFAAMTFDPEPERLARRLCAAIRQPVPWGAVEFHLTAASGLVSGDEDWSAGGEMIPAGYRAARESLQDGRDEVALFTAATRSRMAREASIEDRLWLAIAGDELTLALQPKVRAADGRVLGAEALLRWHDPVLGTVSPTEFIPIAERSGIIGEVTAWVMRRALTQAADWDAAGLDLTMAVNVSAIDLRQPDFVGMVRRLLAETGCSPTRLVLELTESCLADDPERAVAQFCELKGLGVSLSLDDFGTGYSSLSQLRRFPIDHLKIDRSFVHGTPDDSGAVSIVRTIVALAQSLGIETVAEGVETDGQAGFLKRLGVDLLQGFLYGRPLSADAFMALAHAL